MFFTSQSMTSKQRCWFLSFGIERAVPIHPIFLPFPLNANVAWWWNGHSSSNLPVLEYMDVGHCGLMWLNIFIKPWRSFWTWIVTNVKTILLKKILFALSPMALSSTAQMFLAAFPAFAPLLNSEKSLSEMFQFHHMALHFLASAALLIIFKWQNFNM